MHFYELLHLVKDKIRFFVFKYILQRKPFVPEEELPEIIEKTETDFEILMSRKPREIFLEKEVFDEFTNSKFIYFNDTFSYKVFDVVHVVNLDESIEFSFVIVFSFKGKNILRIIDKN